MLIVGSREREREGDEGEAKSNRFDARERFLTTDNQRQWGRGSWWNGRRVFAYGKVWAFESIELTIVGWTDTSRGNHEIVLLGHTACGFDTIVLALAPDLEKSSTHISSSSSAITSIRLLRD
jgi:hypothetical protein